MRQVNLPNPIEIFIYYRVDDIWNLYQDGSILYSKPGIYTSSCSLDLEKFPFDKQN